MRGLFWAVLFLLAPALAAAQTATLIADRVEIEGGTALIAEGNVEVLYGEARLTARRVRYDRETDTLTIEGPLVLTERDGSVILASSAELDGALRRGILRSARVVLDRQLQIAAAQIDRTGGRATRLTRVVASSCEICEEGALPLWEIRAARVIRDEEEQQLYFENAQLRVAGVPVFYAPRLRLPDPSLDRATGFLVPSIRSRTDLGTGIVTPYFVKIGDHADLTLSPYLSGSTTTFGAEYRQELKYGRLAFEGAISDDDIRPDASRGYLFAEGAFYLPRDYTLGFDLSLVSDDSYLFDYGISDRDRLASEVALARVRDDQVVRVQATRFRTLRGRELDIERELPSQLVDFAFSQRLFEDPLWGQAWAGVGGSALNRRSSEPGRGRDVSRLSGDIDWTASRLFGPGFVFEADAGLSFDHYTVRQDPNLPGTGQRVTPRAALALSWPLQRDGENGARHVLEPKLQFAWADTRGDVAPNEDSRVVEFDEANLFQLSRYPGVDGRETGLRMNAGLTWTRYDPDSWSLGLTAGRVFRFDDRSQFTGDTGLSGTVSDWLFSANLKLDDRLDLVTRSLLDDNLDVAQLESRLAWRWEGASVNARHLWRAADRAEGRPDDLSELNLNGSYRLDRFWTLTGRWRLDADAGETTQTGFGLRYENECVAFGLSLSRRFTSSTNVEPVTDIDLQLSLTGLGTGGDTRGPRRRCRG